MVYLNVVNLEDTSEVVLNDESEKSGGWELSAACWAHVQGAVETAGAHWAMMMGVL